MLPRPAAKPPLEHQNIVPSFVVRRIRRLLRMRIM
jgi:hypothetical protein